MIGKSLGSVLRSKNSHDRQEFKEGSRPAVKHHHRESRWIGREEACEMDLVHIVIGLYWQLEIGKAVDLILNGSPGSQKIISHERRV